MSVKIKAVLLSAFILPGLGQLYQGQKVKGVMLIVVVNVFLLGAFYLVLRGVGQLMLAGANVGALNATEVLANLQQNSPAARWLLALFVGVWLYAVVDALLCKGGTPDRDDQEH